MGAMAVRAKLDLAVLLSPVEQRFIALAHLTPITIRLGVAVGLCERIILG